MKKIVFILCFLFWFFLFGKSQNSTPDFTWGNASYFNLNMGDSCVFNNVTIELLKIENHFNTLRIGGDTVEIKVSRRTLPVVSEGICVFVADNKNVKSITSDSLVHGLLTKDVLICASDFFKPLLDANQFTFPVNFSNGFVWNTEVDGYMFAYMGKDEKREDNFFRSHEGIDLDLDDARGLEKHWLVAMENSEVAWIEKYEVAGERAASVLLQSESNPQIFYVYEGLLEKSLEIRKGQKIIQGEILGNVWGDEKNGFLQLAVVKSDTLPQYSQRFFNVVNFFPQLYQLYFNQIYGFSKTYTKGRIVFGNNQKKSENYDSNIHSYENYIGKGWVFDHWNIAQQVECVCKSEQSNARLKKTLFAQSPAEVENPQNGFEYEINVSNGVYRIRAKVGDFELPSWQKVAFEDVDSGTFELAAGEYEWTNERVVKVKDGKLTIRISVDPVNKKIAGLKEIVFQKAY